MSGIVPRSGPAWRRQLAGLPPLPLPAPVGGLACAQLVVAPGLATDPATGVTPVPVGFVQHAPASSGITVRLARLVDDATGAPVTTAAVAIAVVDATGGAAVAVAASTLAPMLGADGASHGDYAASLGVLAPGRYTITAVVTDTPSGRAARRLTVAAVFVVGPYYGG